MPPVGLKVILYTLICSPPTLLELQSILTAAGFRCAAAVAAIAEHSILRQFAQGRPDTEDEAQLNQFAV